MVFFFTIKDNGIYIYIYIKLDWSSKGFRQIKGIDYTCTYSPTIEIEMDSFLD